jgi:hypothetical protein
MASRSKRESLRLKIGPQLWQIYYRHDGIIPLRCIASAKDDMAAMPIEVRQAVCRPAVRSTTAPRC